MLQTKSGRTILLSKCSICNSRKSQFIKKKMKKKDC